MAFGVQCGLNHQHLRHNVPNFTIYIQNPFSLVMPFLFLSQQLSVTDLFSMNALNTNASSNNIDKSGRISWNPPRDCSHSTYPIHINQFQGRLWLSGPYDDFWNGYTETLDRYNTGNYHIQRLHHFYLSNVTSMQHLPKLSILF